ncbi:ATP-dependent endonuclease [candidate division WOR-3 bacterium]|nr:ATP-dependent endonuclease [candidate division WOR-3 bacterium]
MIIKSVEVKNFRSIREAILDCDNLTAIMGRNGAGKSSFLHAIDSFYDIVAPISEEDFFNRDIGASIEIRVTYSDLRDDEKEEFKPYIRNEELIVTKRILSENGRIIQQYYAAALQIPQFAEIRILPTKRDRISAWNELVDSGEFTDLSGRTRSADEVERFMNEYEANHPEFMKPIERKEQFFGPRNIGGGKLDKFTKYVLVPAVREASDEVTGKKGAIYQILDMIVLRKINARKDIQKFKSEFEERVKKLYSSENLTELPELGSSISETLEKFAPGSKLRLLWDEVKPPGVPLPLAKATLIEDNFEGEINRKGHGLQRALILTLLQHLAMITPVDLHIEGSAEEESIVLETKAYESQEGPDLILAIEEPELYLHPSRCRYLAELLLQLTETPEIGLGVKNQIVYTTHSPYFVDLHRFDQIRMVRKVSSPDSLVPQSVVTRFSLKQAAEEMAKVCNADPTKFTRDSFRARAMSVMNTIVNEGFFANVVVVVEGLSEVGTLWKLQEILKKDWSRLGIVVVPAGGKNNIDRPIVIFRGLSIPTYLIFDADSQLMGKGKKEDAAKIRNLRYLRLAGAPTEDFPETQVHETWAVFSENLEGIFKEILGNETFQAIREEAASELGYDDSARAIKNIEGVARLIELIYDKKYKIPILEEIVEKITQLRSIEKQNKAEFV